MTFFGTLKDLAFHPSNKREWLQFIEQNDGRKVYFTVYFDTKQRTMLQNNSLHLWFENMARGLNEAGLDMRKVLKENVFISWTKENIKEFIWKPIMKALTGKEHTSDLNKVSEIDLIYDTLNKHFAEKFKFQVPEFPKE